MKVLFLKDIRNVGRKDEIKEVSDGYALNALIPQGAAVQATPDKIKLHAAALNTRAQTEALQEKRWAEQAAKMEGMVITIHEKANELGHLYHQLAPRVVVESLKREANVTIDANMIDMGEPIRAVGDYRVDVRHGKSIAHITLKVVASK